jgi:hypothetical protein
MRAATVIAVVAAATAAAAQSPSSNVSVFLSVKADVLVTVTKQKMGGDLVEIIPVAQDYPPTLLAKQIAALSRFLGSEPRGTQMYRYEIEQGRPDLTYLEASFGVDGVIDRENGRLAIAPFLKALAGAPAPYTIHGISLIFDDERPTPRTIRTYKSSSVRAEAITSSSPLSIEYRIELLTQDPREISFPDEYTKPPEETTPPAKANRTVLIIALCAVAALTGGALVYLALLRGAPPARSKPTQ